MYKTKSDLCIVVYIINYYNNILVYDRKLFESKYNMIIIIVIIKDVCKITHIFLSIPIYSVYVAYYNTFYQIVCM